MQSQDTINRVATDLLATENLQLISCKTFQSLWAGYGHICQIKATDSTSNHNENTQKDMSLILKYVTPPSIKNGKILDEGHIRKVLSYQIEQYFYTHLALSMPDTIGIAKCLSSINSTSPGGGNGGTTTTAMLLTDLRIPYPIAGEKRGNLNNTQTYSAITWLAKFHGFWWKNNAKIDRSTLCHPPLEHYARTKSILLDQGGGVWLNGGYTYLATRRTEYDSLRTDTSSEWCRLLCTPIEKYGMSIAELVAEVLKPTADPNEPSLISDYETLIHGDVKSENLFLSRDGKNVAFYDFQYVGLGLGVCDLAKLFTCSLEMDMLVDDKNDVYKFENELTMHKKEAELLQFYINVLERESGMKYDWEVFVRHWETALVDWLRFQASWGFWGSTEWLEGRVRFIVRDEGWRGWLMGWF